MNHTINGLLVLDKPAGITSRDAVDRAMKWFPPRTKIGHTGTLDPLATGVLVLCLGRATRLAEFVQAMDKAYRATLVLGARSDTDDADGTITSNPEARPVDPSAIEAALAGFIGTIEQTPPDYSAVKIAGRRAHALARQGQALSIVPRPVNVYGINVMKFAWPEIRLEIACGRGTYIRSLARDLGERLGVGAYVSELRRTRIGPFTAEDALPLTASAQEALGRLRPPADAVGQLPRVAIDDAHVGRFCHGQAVFCPAEFAKDAGALCGVFTARGELIGVGSWRGDGTIQPVKIVTAEIAG
jgi:tRNA pseudouridine55 synthase